MIRKATEKDIDNVEKNYRELLEYEQINGSNSNWVLGLYPTRKTAENAFAEDSLYVMEENGEICASVVLNHVQPDVYNKIDWKYEAEGNDVLVIHTLCVPPSKGGNGYGRKMVDHSLKIAKEMNCSTVRLETYIGNTPAASLYKNMGFIYAGSAEDLFQGVIPEELIFFEIEI